MHDPREIPIEPLVIEVSDAERAALRSALGGITTTEGTPEHEVFKRMDDFGFVKEVMSPPGRTAWRLTRVGAEIANSVQP